MSKTYSRLELYDLVWSTPISKLADQFGISDRGLAKTCARHQIPVPGRGYWAKIEAGQHATKTSLWKIDNPALETVHIGGAKVSVAYATFAVQEAQRAVDSAKSKRAATGNAVEKRLTTEAPTSPSAPFGPPKRPHPSIIGISHALKAARPTPDGEIAIPGIRIHQNSRKRTVGFLNDLATTLDIEGISLGEGERALKASKGSDTISFEITEGRQRVKHEPSAAELKKAQDHERKREIAHRRGGWLFAEKFWPEFDYLYSGKLAFEINNWAAGARKKWSDGKQQTFDTMLQAIAEGIIFHLAHEKARREQKQEEDRQRAHLAHRRDLHAKRQDREAKRVTFLADLAEYQREASQLKEVIESAQKLSAPVPAEYQRMLDWAKGRLAHLDAQNETANLTAKITSEQLFPEPDDLFDPEGDPPPKRGYWD